MPTLSATPAQEVDADLAIRGLASGAAEDSTPSAPPPQTAPTGPAAPAAPVAPTTQAAQEDRALRIAALLAVAAIVWVAFPVGIGVLLGVLTAFTLLPVYLKLRARLRRPAPAALLCVVLTALGACGVLAGFGYLLIGRGIGLLRNIGTFLQPGGPVRHFFEHVSARLPRLGIQPDTVVERVGGAAADVSMRLASLAPTVAGATLSAVLALFFLLVTSYYVLQNWISLSRHAEVMLPLNPADTRALLGEFRRVGRSVLLGTVLTGIAQGLLAGLGFFVTRVPDAAFFGAATALASLVPGIGTALVWVPLGVYLLLTGHVALGIVELLYSAAIVVGFCDYVLRPRLIGGHGEVPPLLTLVALFGGLSVFGVVGLLLGPIIMSLALALLRIYEREATRRRSPSQQASAPSATAAAIGEGDGSALPLAPP